MEKPDSGMSPALIESLCMEFEKHNHIPSSQYEKFGVKRGLRNADGTGVMAGLTLIGNVQGYVLMDGERMPVDGKLIYRGIDMEDIIAGFSAEKRFGFEEVAYLLLFGALPNAGQSDMFAKTLERSRTLPEGFTEDMIIKAPSKNVMNKLARGVLALYSYDDNPEDCSLKNMLRQSIELISRFPTIIAHAHAVKRHYFDKESLYLHRPQENLSIAENFLHSIRPDNQFTDEEARLLDLCLVMHAEHGGGNNSAFAARVLASSGTDTYSAISAAVGSLKGPRHGGANIKVMEMFTEICEKVGDWEDEDEVLAYLGKILRKEAGDGSGLIYGMGHAIYTISDPRTVILKKSAKSLAAKRGMLKQLSLMETVERLAPSALADVKNETKLVCANVDMYSGLVYEMMDIPHDLYTPLFAMARIVGWCAHRIEEAMTGGRIIRPAYKSLSPHGVYIPMANRE